MILFLHTEKNTRKATNHSEELSNLNPSDVLSETSRISEPYDHPPIGEYENGKKIRNRSNGTTTKINPKEEMQIGI